MYKLFHQVRLCLSLIGNKPTKATQFANSHKFEVIKFACLTRTGIVLLQFVGNLLIPDHHTDAFLYPKENLTYSFCDSIVNGLLGGFVRWDAQYFMHIAKYGYTYENMSAFFPFCPLVAKGVVVIISHFVPFLNEDSLLLITFLFVNWYFFLKAALALYDLSSMVLNKSYAFKSAILFCMNPASVFFVAPYTECIFSYLSFKCMLNCMIMYERYSKTQKIYLANIISIIIPLALSTSVRSNGILNVGFLVYFMLKMFVENFLCLSILKVAKCGILLTLLVLLSLTPFICIQIYHFHRFCTDFSTDMPNFLSKFGNGNLILPGKHSIYNQSWCYATVPLSYSYVQSHYWNVGFLRYFELKQIPNFILAAPIITIIIVNSFQFLRTHKEYCLNLGIFTLFGLRKTDKYLSKMFVFIVHGLFLTLFCTFCVHVQVTTRMLCSASPILYWFSAHYFEDPKSKPLFISFLSSYSSKTSSKVVIFYFVTYATVGTILFANHLPWT